MEKLRINFVGLSVYRKFLVKFSAKKLNGGEFSIKRFRVVRSALPLLSKIINANICFYNLVLIQYYCNRTPRSSMVTLSGVNSPKLLTIGF